MIEENTREKGKKLENLVLSYIQKYDKKAYLTKNSGAGLIKCDIVNNLDMQVECKNHQNKNIIFKIADWDKTVKDIPCGQDKYPVAFTKVDDGRTFVIVELNDFFNRLISEIYEEEK